MKIEQYYFHYLFLKIGRNENTFRDLVTYTCAEAAGSGQPSSGIGDLAVDLAGSQMINSVFFLVHRWAQHN